MPEGAIVPTNLDEGNPLVGSPGGSGDTAGSGGSQEMQSQLAAAEERRRHFQSLADQRAVEILRLKSQQEVGMQSEEVNALLEARLQGIKVPSAADITAQVMAAVRADRQYDRFREGLAQKYAGVNVEGLTGTPEEMEQAAKTAFDERAAQAAALREEVLATVRAEFEAKHGPLDDGNSDALDQGDGGATQDGELTPERFAALSDEELDKLDNVTFDRLAAIAQAKGL